LSHKQRVSNKKATPLYYSIHIKCSIKPVTKKLTTLHTFFFILKTKYVANDQTLTKLSIGIMGNGITMLMTKDKFEVQPQASCVIWSAYHSQRWRTSNRSHPDEDWTTTCEAPPRPTQSNHRPTSQQQ